MSYRLGFIYMCSFFLLVCRRSFRSNNIFPHQRSSEQFCTVFFRSFVRSAVPGRVFWMDWYIEHKVIFFSYFKLSLTFERKNFFEHFFVFWRTKFKIDKFDSFFSRLHITHICEKVRSLSKQFHFFYSLLTPSQRLCYFF